MQDEARENNQISLEVPFLKFEFEGLFVEMNKLNEMIFESI